MNITDEQAVLGHLELMARAIYRIGKDQGAGAAREQIRMTVDALRMMEETMEATLTGPRVQ